MDQYVLNTQKWVNENFKGQSGYTVIEENGQTGWNTIYALLHALQITLKVGSTANNFGPGTENAFLNYINTEGPIEQQDTEETVTETRKMINGIIQGALLCKGYSIGASGPTGNFYAGTGNAIKRLKEDAGLSDTSTVVTLNIMKALMSMDYFYSYSTSEKTKNIQAMQRYLNGHYEDYIGLTPCDGVYSRETSKDLIYAIQAEEKLPIGTANGNCGPSTKKCLPNIPYTGGYNKDGTTYGLSYNGNTYSAEDIKNFAILANMALYFNGYGEGKLTSELDTATIMEFQEEYSINATGNIDYSTWLSLLISCGDTDRSAIACDCATIITNSNISVLTNNNYKYIGRYLSGQTASGASKALSTDELKILFSNGIRLFPIHQRSATSVSYFTEANAKEDADLAVEYANLLYLQFGAIIYFAVDFDATDAQITNYLLPYFRALYESFMNKGMGKYRIGVYGTRNVCTRVCDAGYACSSFVGDMSTGFSGNLGFPIPKNWAFDQFTTTKISSGSNSIEIDKDGFSGRYQGISQEYSIVENNTFDGSLLDFGNTVRILTNFGDSPIPVYQNKTYVEPETGAVVPNRRVDGPIIGYINSHDFYLRYPLLNQESDNIHRVMFNNGTDVLMGYIQEKFIFGTFGETHEPNDDDNIEAQILPAQEPFTCVTFNQETNDCEVVPYAEEHIFTIKRNVPYYNTYGDFIGMLKDGDVIRIAHASLYRTGALRPWCTFVDEIKFGGTGEFQTFNMYVSVGIEYASNGKNRAWY